MVTRDIIGYTLPAHATEVDAAGLRAFARAIGETGSVYLDENAARAAGYHSLPVPPTFLFCMDMDVPEPYAYLDDLGVDLGRVLHAEQSFHYHRIVGAGERLTFHSRITDIDTRKSGALTFMVRDTTVHDGKQTLVAELRSVIVVRNTPAPPSRMPPPETTAPEDWTATLYPPRVSREILVRYADASGDHNPIHVDPAFARQHGLDDVIAHGMLAVAYLGRMLTNWVTQPALHSLRVRFVRMIEVHDQLACRGRIAETWQENGMQRARLELQVIGPDQDLRIVGDAVVTLHD